MYAHMQMCSFSTQSELHFTLLIITTSKCSVNTFVTGFATRCLPHTSDSIINLGDYNLVSSTI